MNLDDQYNSSNITSPSLSNSLQNFSFQERPLIVYRKCWIVISILIFFLFAGLITFAIIKPPKGDRTMFIWLILLLIIFELVIQSASSGWKVVIDNINKTISFKRTGLFSCNGWCRNRTFALSDVQHVNYDVIHGVERNRNCIRVTLEVQLREGGREIIFNMKTRGACSSENSMGVPFDIKETMEYINNMINTHNKM